MWLHIQLKLAELLLQHSHGVAYMNYRNCLLVVLVQEYFCLLKINIINFSFFIFYLIKQRKRKFNIFFSNQLLVTFHRIFREANKCADILANIDCGLPMAKVEFESPLV